MIPFPKEAPASAFTSSVLGWGRLQQEHTVFVTSQLGFLSISVILTSINKQRKTLAFLFVCRQIFTSLETATSPLMQGSNRNDVSDFLSCFLLDLPELWQVDTSVQKPSTAVTPQEETGFLLRPVYLSMTSGLLGRHSEPRHPMKSS